MSKHKTFNFQQSLAMKRVITYLQNEIFSFVNVLLILWSHYDSVPKVKLLLGKWSLISDIFPVETAGNSDR